MKPLRYPETSATVEQLRPLGDLVLVRPLPEEEKIGSVVLPDNARTPERGLRRGKVIAAGPGDRAFHFKCDECFADYSSTVHSDDGKVFAVSACPRCGSKERSLYLSVANEEPHSSRRPMHVKPGDTVIYPRVPSGGVMINGAECFLIHEEQHVLAVIE